MGGEIRNFRFYSIKKALTLVELVTSLVLLGVIVVTPIALDLYVNQQQRTQRRRFQLVQEAILVMEYISRSIQQAIGDSGNWAVNIADIDGDGIQELTFRNSDSTPSNFNDDTYGRIDQIGDDIYFIPDINLPSSYIVLAENMAVNDSTFKALLFTSTPGVDGKPFRIKIEVVLRHDPSKDWESITNPQIKLQTAVSCQYPKS